MKLVILLMLMLPLTACHISRGFQPPPYTYETYYKHKKRDTPFEIIKKDMLSCGFDTPASGYIKSDDEHDTKYINASLCMESKGYRKSSIDEPTICMNPVYKNEPACQKYLNRK